VEWCREQKEEVQELSLVEHRKERDEERKKGQNS
jgi:hypothetical protein